MTSLEGPSYRVETARLSLCCFVPTDVELVHEAVLSSLDHLRPFMNFVAREPVSLDERLVFLRTQRGHFDLDGDYHFGIFDKAHTRMLGAAALVMNGEVYEREVGYWIRADSVRQGLATEAVSALIRVAFDLEALTELDLRVDPGNVASAGIARKLGFAGPEVAHLALTTPGGEKRDAHVYAMSRVAYAESPLSAYPIEAYDVLGRRLL